MTLQFAPDRYQRSLGATGVLLHIAFKGASSTVYLGIGIREDSGTIWIDNIQQEEGTLANRYNLFE